VARVAKEAGAKLLVLTHLNPGERAEELLDTAAGYFGGPVVIASDGLSLAV
jgi:ribonuclease BN (tRNA processing enzyme)